MIPTFDIVKMSKNVEKFEQAMRDRNREITRLLNTSFSFTIEKPGVIQAQVFLDTRVLKSYIDMSVNAPFNGFINKIYQNLKLAYYQENPQPKLNISDFSESDDEWLVYQESVEEWRQAFDVAWNSGRKVPVPLVKVIQVTHEAIEAIKTSANIAEITQMYLSDISGVTIVEDAFRIRTIRAIVKSLFGHEYNPTITISLEVKDTENINASNLEEKVIPGGPSITKKPNSNKIYIGNGNLFYILL